MKYIVMALADKEEIFIFPRTVDHEDMFEVCETIRFGDNSNWSEKYRNSECIAAGFIDNGQCYGRSESLNIDSRGESDTKLLANLMLFSSNPTNIEKVEVGEPPIPKGIYYIFQYDNFYDCVTNEGMGNEFHEKWIHLYDHFPSSREAASLLMEK